MIQPYSLYTNGKQVSIRVQQHTYQLSHYILGIHNSRKRVRCFFLNGDAHDFRRCNLMCGNHYEDCGDATVVRCSNGTQFIIDSTDVALISDYIWYVDKNGYVISSRGNAGRAMKIHRLILGIVDLSYDTVEVDHINRDSTDNRRCNLRIVDRSTNCHNTSISTMNTTGVKGVYKSASYDKYCAQINVMGKRIYLGAYSTLNDACAARIAAEIRYGIEPQLI